MRADANKAVEAKMARAKTPARRAEIGRDARVEAMRGLLPDTGDGLRAVTDEATGDVSYKGKIDPGDPVHRALLDEFGYSPAQEQALLDAQAKFGQGVVLRDYQSAAQVGFEEGGADLSSKQRAAEYKASKPGEVGERRGEVSGQDKPFTPLQIVATKKGLNIFGFDHDKFLNNTRAVLDAAHTAGIKTGYEGLTGEKLDNEIAADFRTVSANHQIGASGDGSRQLEVFPDMKPGKKGKAQPVDPDRANVINMSMHNQGAKAPEKPAGATEGAQKRFQKAQDVAKQAIGLADLNRGFRTPEGEVNPLRDALSKAGFDVDATLKLPFDNVRPDLIAGGVHDTPGHGKSVHAHGFDIDPKEFTAAGLPRKDFVSGGFKPKNRQQHPGDYPDELADVVRSTKVGPLRKQEGYDDAKYHADGAAADGVVAGVLKPQAVDEVRRRLGDAEDPIFLPVIQREVADRTNALPIVYAHELEQQIGGRVSTDIFKVKGKANIGAHFADRVANEQLFDGPVEKGGIYVIVDDVFTSGNTVTALIDHIHAGGAEVRVVTTLADSQAQNYLRPRPQDLAKLLDRAGTTEQGFRDALGYPVSKLTGAEVYRLANLDRGNWKGVEDLVRRLDPERGGANPERGGANSGSGARGAEAASGIPEVTSRPGSGIPEVRPKWDTRYPDEMPIDNPEAAARDVLAEGDPDLAGIEKRKHWVVLDSITDQPNEYFNTLREGREYMDSMSSAGERLMQREPGRPDRTISKRETNNEVVTGPGNDCDFVSRYFAPAAGIPEDPVTGSTHCTLIPYWSQRLGTKELFARQISARGGELFCRDRGDRVSIGGAAATYVAGEIVLD